MKNRLYPITYKGKIYKEKDCSGIFTSFYNSIESLRYNMSVYIGDGMSIFPDGEWTED